MLNNNNFTEHFDLFINKINNNVNFTFARYADGERMILNNINISQGTQAYDVDKWSYNNNNLFASDLLETCFHTENNYYYAISCLCCDPDGLNFYKKLLKTNNLTFSNLFINANYKKFNNFINSLKRDVCLIANKNCINSKYPFNVKLKVAMDNDCINWYEKNKNKLITNLKKIAETYIDQLFFISVGPLSEIIIHNLYIINPNNTYIDVGSSLDIYTHKKITRPYQLQNSIYHNKNCVF